MQLFEVPSALKALNKELTFIIHLLSEQEYELALSTIELASSRITEIHAALQEKVETSRRIRAEGARLAKEALERIDEESTSE